MSLELIAASFAASRIPAEELLLHLEPALVDAVSGSGTAEAARELINRVERVVFTEVEPTRFQHLRELINEAIALAAGVDDPPTRPSGS